MTDGGSSLHGDQERIGGTSVFLLGPQLSLVAYRSDARPPLSSVGAALRVEAYW